MIRVRTTVTGTRTTQEYLNRSGQKLGNQFQKEIITRARALSVQMQTDMNNAVDRGPVSFTQRSVLFTFKKTGKSSVRASILIKDVQANYLHEVLVKPKSLGKFIPTSSARLTKQGNISGLKNNLSKKRYIIVESGGKKRLIDTSKKDTKKRTKRIIGVKESKRRQLIYDFYEKAEQGAVLILSDIRGTFKLRNG
ncbi:hypothetical protein EDF81_0088 [Enterobacter sp. BIGb0383]|uniref:hypothetical protein n=1 Tax=unclassified Enterobacter TaxID=2608935 RepID=UPI000FA7FB55|nr:MULTISPECIES: hypothetical protein [unclassified Enterobacter]ROP61617.1 hypothetical protein EDF81_0088 [Enterobacter sp. BIGb0383]ROS11778.1 hypothetical protein EC848_0088 [Enterobacter sp. BIGb0359]